MNSKKKTRSLIIILVMLCLFAGAWLVFTVNQRMVDRVKSDAAEVASIIDDGEPVLQEMGASAEYKLEEWTIADRVYSHRGSAGAKEHSFEAYDEAIAAGSHNIEQDVVISKDGTLYVSHDLSAYAMTNSNAYYSDMTDDEIDTLERRSGGKVLKLREVFERYGRSVHYLIELKSSDDASIEAFQKEVDDHGLSNVITAQSLDISVLDKLEDIYPEMPKLLVVKTDAALELALNSESVDMVGARVQYVNAVNCKTAHDRGKKFIGWTLDSEADIRNAIKIGADAYFTNDTALAIELERKYRPVKSSAKRDHSSLFFASDYQEEAGFDAPRDTLSLLLAAAIADGKELDMAVLCGDYTNDVALHDYQISPEDSISEIIEVIGEQAPQISDDNMLFVQGNHDKLTESIAASGLHEYDDYLIYVLNTENDFPWKQGKVAGSHAKVKEAASDMKDCFDALISSGEKRPVFIAGHVPLHFTARTSSRHTTGDNLYASLTFDVVNEAAESLDIIYLYGHNHSKGWDCYLGGASVYKAVGDILLLPSFNGNDLNTDTFDEKTLNFTYLNAGYTGYYMNCAQGDNPEDFRAADETLTATVFDVFEDRIEITRYGADGRHMLGAEGAANPYKGGIDAGLIDSKYYSKETSSPSIITLSK